MSNNKLNPSAIRSLEVQSYNESSNTITVIASTEYPVLRYSYDIGQFYEVLDMKESSANLYRLNNSAPFLNSHSQETLSDVLGVVQKAYIVDSRLEAVIKLSQRESVKDIINDIKSGIIKNISIGYRVMKYKQDKEEINGVKVYRAIEWEPTEISAVPVPADPYAAIRSDKQFFGQVTLVDSDLTKGVREMENLEITEEIKSEEIIEEVKEITETDEIMDEEKTMDSEEEDSMDMEEIKAEARKAEAMRQSEIRKLGGKHNYDVSALLDEGVSVDKARSIILDALAETKQATIKRSETIEVKGAMDNHVKSFEEYLLNRLNPAKYGVTEGSRRFAGYSMLDVTKEIMTDKGEAVRAMARDEFVSRSLSFITTGDLAGALSNVMNKTLQERYEFAGRILTGSLVTNELVNDFKPIKRFKLNATMNMIDGTSAKTLEAGPIGKGKIAEAEETMQLQSFKSEMAFTREMLINDDIGALQRFLADVADEIIYLEEKLVADIFNNGHSTANIMSDGNPVFHASHANIGTPADLSTVDAINDAFLKMEKQTDLFGRPLLNNTPAFLIVPSALRATGMRVVSNDFTANTEGTQKALGGGLNLIVSPHLSDEDGWFVASNKEALKITMLRYSGTSGRPQIKTEMAMDGSLKVLVMHDVAAKALDFRGLYKNAGV